MCFNRRPVPLYIKTIDIVDKDNGVGITHRDTGNFKLLTVNYQRIIFYHTIEIHRYLPRLKYRLSHIDLHHVTGPLRPYDARCRFHRKRILYGDAPVPYVFCKAADAVAAHLDLASV